MDLVWVVIFSLGLITAVFLYIFMFRIPAAQINQKTAQRLMELYADTDPARERTTLLLRSREPEAGELKALVVWLDGYELLDLSRQILPTAFEDYYEAAPQRLLWREAWPQADYDRVHQSSVHAYEQKLAELQQDGWSVVFDLPFSRVDHIIYLQRQRR